MGSESRGDQSKESSSSEEKKLKPCCACPETKLVRDKWLVHLHEIYFGQIFNYANKQFVFF